MWKLEIRQTPEEIYDTVRHMRKRPEMYTGRTSYARIVSYWSGYHIATGLLIGFREWLIPKAGMNWSNCGFEDIILSMINFPGGSFAMDHSSESDQKAAIEALCDFILEFLHYKEEVGEEKIIADYEKAHAEWREQRRREIYGEE